TFNVQPVDAAMVLNDRIDGQLETPFSQDRWHFAAVANQQVQFHVVAAQPDIQFALTGPNGYQGFSGSTTDSALLTLPATGTYTLPVATANRQVGAYAFQVNAGQVDLQLGTPFNGAIAGSGQTQLFRLNVPSASPLQVVLHDTAAADHNEVY